MNEALPIDFARAPRRPTLPRPMRMRWQPLRLGLVELFRFDSEEFWFRDGHLLLRGNNGTGKSKVLSLTLPFLFDAQLKSSRIEPDGDAGKKMAWNLLLGVQERRTGYAWIEFGRRDGDGREHYLTLGAGLQAAAARAQVDTWYFIVEDQNDGQGREPVRIGEGLWLISENRHVLSRERLRERLEGQGQVFDNARTYRRAVDERLFHLGSQRYDALIDTLIQLRQPQLSKKPDERLLSDALSEALPPLSPDLLTDVADAMSQLEDDRRQLERYQKLVGAVSRFDARYRVYAGMQSRRQARLVRQAQTEFDSASQSRNAAVEQLALARHAEDEARTSHEVSEDAHADAAARYEALLGSPEMQDAKRLSEAKSDAEARARSRTVAEAARDAARIRLDRDAAEARRLETDAERSIAALLAARSTADGTARLAGVTAHVASALVSAEPSHLVGLPKDGIDDMASELRLALAERRRQVEAVRRRLDEVAGADAECRRRLESRDERREELTASEMRSRDADASVEREGGALTDAWDAYLGTIVHLRVPDADRDGIADALGAWVEAFDGANPALQALRGAQQSTMLRFAAEASALDAETSTFECERDALEVERSRLVAGADIAPLAPPTRAPDARIGRPGAPLWQLIDFRSTVERGIRAGLEAALEASGLLDAWVDPDGRIEHRDGTVLADTRVLRRPKARETLRALLVPSVPEGCPVSSDHIGRLLAGVACAPEDPGDGESWIATDGRFRLGPLEGAWTKAEAGYIGFAARKAARQRRLAEIDTRLGEVAASLARVEAATRRLAADRDAAEQEWLAHPTDDALRKAHARATIAASDVVRTRDRLAESERLHREADEAARAARQRLATDAADLRLPATAAALDEVGNAIERCRDAFDQLASTAREVGRASADAVRQQQREAETRLDHAARDTEAAEARRASEQAAARLDVLLSSVGAKVEEIHRRIEAARGQREASEVAVKKAVHVLSEAGKQHAVAAGMARVAEAAFAERSSARLATVLTFQQFCTTGMLASAWADAAIPDLGAAWTIDPALSLARRAEQALATISDDETTWARVQKEVMYDITDLQRELSALGERAEAESTAFGMVVRILYRNRPERPDNLIGRLAEEIDARGKLLTAKERDILENHLEAEIAAEIQRLLQVAEAQRQRINAELYRRPTTTGVRYRLLWQPLGEDEGAPSGFEPARKRLLATNTELWAAEDRDVVGRMLQGQIAAERERADAEGASGSIVDLLARALDYRRWHRFRIERFQDGDWRKLSGPASSGERALGLTVPLFAAVASFYGPADDPRSIAPRLILLDEAFAGIDDAARRHCMALIREFDLDFVITSEREWACYAELPGVSICQLQRREGIDAVYVSRWTWDGKARQVEADPDRRFPAP